MIWGEELDINDSFSGVPGDVRVGDPSYLFTVSRNGHCWFMRQASILYILESTPLPFPQWFH